MFDNYDEINELFKLQAQHLFESTSSESYELSENMENYTSVTNNKMFSIQQMLQSKKCLSL